MEKFEKPSCYSWLINISINRENETEPVFLNIYGAQKSIPRTEFSKPM
jgi:hypothetical protein